MRDQHPPAAYNFRMAAPIIAVTGALLDASGDRPPRIAVNAAYLRAVEQAGGVPWLLPPGLGIKTIRAMLDRCDGLMLTGGADISPACYGEPLDGATGISEPRDAMEFAAVEYALEGQMPLLAICRGLQVLNVALGGSLWQDLPSQRPSGIAHRQPEDRHIATHEVGLEAESTLTAVLGATSVMTNSMHHQGINRLGGGLCATARTTDGLIEGVEIPGHPFALAVQWHPEELVATHEHARRLFASFIESCNKR